VKSTAPGESGVVAQLFLGVVADSVLSDFLSRLRIVILEMLLVLPFLSEFGERRTEADVGVVALRYGVAVAVLKNLRGEEGGGVVGVGDVNHSDFTASLVLFLFPGDSIALLKI
jgi:hypothetical protein